MQEDSNTMIHSTVHLGTYCLAAAAFGLASHWTYWVHGHRVRHATWTFLFHLAALFILGWKLTSVQGNLLSGLGATAAIFLSYLGTLFTSIVVYRVFSTGSPTSLDHSSQRSPSSMGSTPPGILRSTIITRP